MTKAFPGLHWQQLIGFVHESVYIIYLYSSFGDFDMLALPIPVWF